MYEEIKAEIERRQRELATLSLSENIELRRDAAIQNGAYEHLLSFIESMEKNPCDGCVNDKGCVTCVNGNMRESLEKEQPQIAQYPQDAPLCYSNDLKPIYLEDIQPKIKGWVARDKDGELSFFSILPTRFDEVCKWVVMGACIVCNFGFSKSFPELKWEDEPLEVELEIHRV